MHTRTRAFWIVAVPIAVCLGISDARVRAQALDGPGTAPSFVEGQAPIDQPTASRSGIDLTALDKTANPCSDFYQFACGGWMAKHPIPADQPIYGRFEELQDRNNEILRDILEGASKARASVDADTKKIGDYYASCMDEATIDAKGASPLKPDFDRIAAIKTTADLPQVVGRMHTVGEGALFAFGAAPDFKDASQYILIAGQGGMGLPDRDYYLKDDANAVKLRGEYEQHVAKMLQLAGDQPQQAAVSAKAILQIETALAKASLDRVSRRNPSNIYHKMSRGEAAKLTPGFDFASYLQAAEAPAEDSVNVTEPEFMKAVDQVTTSTPIADLRAYLRWHVIHANAPMLSKPFVDENFAFYGAALRGAKEQRARWKRCVAATDSDLGEALGKSFVERTFGAEGKERTSKMVEAIEGALDRDIKEITWMSDETKKAAEVKLRAVTNKIGYPDRWRDYSALRIVRGDAFGNSQRANTFEYRRELAKIGKPVDKGEWGMTPPTVNAYYNPLENNINFPAGILQPPFFNKGADDAVNFGAVVAVVGHELTHGFDDSGRRFDAQGNLRDWWTPADGKAFDERAACIADQYSGYTAVDDVKLNGKLTLGENTADNGGLRLAWMALMEDLKTKALGEADGFTPEQRFFLGWAQMWCENRTDEIARLHAKTNPHSPGRFRTIGVLSNMPEFQKAFSCAADSTMVNPKICRVW
jgi:endothelin-converting enzyme/putative endopeptidase